MKRICCNFIVIIKHFSKANVAWEYFLSPIVSTDKKLHLVQLDKSHKLQCLQDIKLYFLKHLKCQTFKKLLTNEKDISECLWTTKSIKEKRERKKKEKSQ